MDARVTEIRSSGGENPRLTVFVDGREAFTVSEEVARELGLEVGRVLGTSEAERLEADDEKERAREAALRLLAVRARSEGELLDRLRRRGFADDVAAGVISSLAEVGLVDDVAFARAWADERMRLKPVGPRRLRQELLARRVDSELVARVVSETYGEHSELELARRAAQRRRRTGSGPTAAKERARLRSFLLRRGFSHDIVAAVLKETGEDSDA